MPNILSLANHAVGQPQPQVAYGQVCQPAPLSFSAPLRVIVPDWDPNYFFEVPNWEAGHGTTLPQVGADVLLVTDSRGNRRVSWWSGITAFPASLPPSGTAGGVLSGTYPNPGFAQAPLEAANNLSDVASAATSRASLGLPDGSGNAPFPQLQAGGQLVQDFNGNSGYSVTVANQGTGSVASAAFTTVRSSWTTGMALGGLFNTVVHGTTTHTAVAWSYALTAPNTFTIYVNNNSGLSIDWSWFGGVVGI